MIARGLLLFALAVGTVGTVGCTKAVGEPCEVTGDGFTRRDPCAEMCLAWPITCEDGREVTPDECSGVVCGDGTECPEGQVCQQVDSFPQNARCVRVEVCGQAG